MKLIYLTWLVFLVVSCASQPEPSSGMPNIEIPEQWAAYRQENPTIEISNSLSSLFGRDDLMLLLEKLDASNLDIADAKSKVDSLLALRRQTGSLRFPTLNVGLDRVRSGGDKLPSTNSYALNFSSSWQIDLLGKLADDYKASELDSIAENEDLNALKQSLAAQLTRAWLDTIAAMSELEILEQQYLSHKNTEELIRDRFLAGVVSLEDLNLAKSSSEETKVSIEAQKQIIDNNKRTLQVLAGEYPDGSWVVSSDLPKNLPNLPVDLPSDILLSRPDIRAAQFRVFSADKTASARYKNLFPSFSLTGNYGETNRKLHELKSIATGNTWSLTGGLLQSIFDAGNRKAVLDESKQAVIQANIDYSRIVLNAFNEVETQLSAQERLNNQVLSQTKSLNYLQLALDRQREQYSNGLTNILDFLSLQRQTYISARQLVLLKNQQLQSRVSLALALGKAY